MLRLVIAEDELFDEETNTFQTVNDSVIEFEHSLISLSKWESEYKKPFLSSEKKTPEEILGYLKAMIVSDDTDPDVLYRLPTAAIEKIQEYIDSSQSATTFGMMPERRGPGEVITSELIYYWMVAFNIPFECQHWHLNRLFSLIRICNIKNSKPEKMSRSELAQRNAALNAKRRAELGTKG
jgi:hypothetical protein